jgi:hypothetical protein
MRQVDRNGLSQTMTAIIPHRGGLRNGLLYGGAKVILAGYRHVRTASGSEHWVYDALVMAPIGKPDGKRLERVALGGRRVARTHVGCGREGSS